MAKKFKLIDILSIEGTPYKIPLYNSSEDGKTKTKSANLADLFKIFPRERMSMENVIHGAQLKSQLLSSADGVLVLEEAEHNWVKKMMWDDTIGPKIFGFFSCKYTGNSWLI